MGTWAIAEIAGRDSVAAAVAAVNERGFDTLLPTIALTGTEVGDANAPFRAIATLRSLLGDRCDVLEPITLIDHDLWLALNTLYAGTIQERWNVCSPCLACHLYLHLLRIPVAWLHDNAPVISGERDSHDGRIKLSQTPGGIDVAVEIMARAGIELVLPIRHASGEHIGELVGGSWDADAGQLGCLYSGNYVDPSGAVRYDETGYARYVSEFLQPAGRAVVRALEARRDHPSPNDQPDWSAIIGAVLG